MFRFNKFTFIYLAIAAAFLVIGFSQFSYDAWLAAGFSGLWALGSALHLWHQGILSLGARNNFLLDLASVALIVATQIFGLVTDAFGWSYLLFGALLLVLVSRIEDTVVLQQASKLNAEPPQF